MTILVTGGAGFIGSHVVDQLIDQGHDVRVYDALVEQVHRGQGPRYVPEGVEFIHADVRDRDSLVKAIKGVDKIIHLAAEVGVGQSMYEISRYVDGNTSATGVLLDVLANEKHEVCKISVASSISIYGEGSYRCTEHGDVVPGLRTEQQLGQRLWEARCPVCDREVTPQGTPESKQLIPGSVYAISKMDQELLCLVVGAAYGIDVTALRYFNAYGPRQALSNPYTGVAAIFSGRLLNDQAPVITEDGGQMRDFIHVNDIARATVKSLTAPKARGKAINIGIGDPISVYDVATTLAGTLGKDIEPEVTGKYRVGDIRHCWADPTLARELLDFEPEYRFRDQGVKELVEWVATQQAAEDAFSGAIAELDRRGLRL